MPRVLVAEKFDTAATLWYQPILYVTQLTCVIRGRVAQW